VNERSLESAVDDVATRRPVLPLRCQVRHYAWGGFDFIPALLGESNPGRTPFAELWVGAHPAAPSVALLPGTNAPLDQLLARTAEPLLGPEVAARFGPTLPYLLKILDVRAMLSIQAHPDKRQAEDGFRRERAALIPLDAAHRNYKDDNHKPEALVAISEFWMLHGFKPLEAIADTLDGVPELRPLLPDFGARLAAAGSDPGARHALLRSLYEHAMLGPQEDIDRLLGPLLSRLRTAASRRAYDKAAPDFWAVRAADQFPLPEGHFDRGIISIYLLNLVRLPHGQGIYIPAGLLHAHLEGTAVEIMASSDNVLRGGLTSKHVDVPELLSVLTFQSTRPAILGGDRVSASERRFATPAPEFELSRLDVSGREPYASPGAWGADALLVLDGRAELLAGTETLALDRGAAVLVPNGRAYEIHASGSATIFKASVPNPL
jgi:mannose-6-phosphate isomerase